MINKIVDRFMDLFIIDDNSG